VTSEKPSKKGVNKVASLTCRFMSKEVHDVNVIMCRGYSNVPEQSSSKFAPRKYETKIYIKPL
jgi:hypothetical protein